ncbi:SWIM zinc finger family protein [Halococcus salifodinae]|uniref:Zinc finger SWIM domain-containing protein n=1 Tax=Halococcus salifodinae DSM 8989 TaxID=1227456 RepID=M0NDT9_9EURY|nr:SWIM zinc finger family protein [Halococcus salifodinae]EMA54855.1 zinc finger SWIM domain-containing protein [Halococcus salifodinae DSM 8989]
MSTNETPQTEAPTTNHQRDTEAVAKRVHRALDSFFHVEATVDDGEYTVFSGSSSTYTVDLSDGTCTCPDGQRGPWCKHAYRAAFVAGEIPDIDGVHVAVSEDDSSDDDRDVDGENDDSETLAERVERFEQANPDASAIMVISQLGIDPNQKERVEEVLAE